MSDNFSSSSSSDNKPQAGGSPPELSIKLYVKLQNERLQLRQELPVWIKNGFKCCSVDALDRNAIMIRRAKINDFGDCVLKARIGDIDNLRKEYWKNSRSLDGVSTKKIRMTKLLLKSFDQKNRSFSFFCGDLSVCETCFITLLGTISTSDSRQWQCAKQDLLTAHDNGSFDKFSSSIIMDEGYIGYIYKY